MQAGLKEARLAARVRRALAPHLDKVGMAASLVLLTTQHLQSSYVVGGLCSHSRMLRQFADLVQQQCL
jgi:hypothetical protein